MKLKLPKLNSDMQLGIGNIIFLLTVVTAFLFVARDGTIDKNTSGTIYVCDLDYNNDTYYVYLSDDCKTVNIHSGFYREVVFTYYVTVTEVKPIDLVNITVREFKTYQNALLELSEGCYECKNE